MTARRDLLAAVASALVLAPTAGAAQTRTSVIDDVFSEFERQIIDRYLHRHAQHEDDDKPDKDKKVKKNKKDKKAPPGLAKRSSLPPGLAKRDTLPPGLAKRDFPPDLLEQLPPAKRGTERVLVGDNAVLIEVATGRVLDIIEVWLADR